MDVEGSELDVLLSLGLGARLSVGVMLIEVRADGGRPRLMARLLRLGMAYVGQVNGRPSGTNEIIDDVYVNLTHMRAYFPESRALLGLPPQTYQ